MVDPIADFLTRIRNAQMAKQVQVSIPYSGIKYQMAQVMQKNKYLLTVKKDTSDTFPRLVLELDSAKNVTLKRVSRCGQRIYIGASNIRQVLNGLGISIISTSEGVMTGREARKKNIGGEVLCEVY